MASVTEECERFGIPEAGFDIVREEPDLAPIARFLRSRTRPRSAAHEVMTETSFSSTAPIHAFVVDSEGTSATARRWSGGSTSTARPARPSTAASTTATATLLGQPGVTVFGPFFVLPFRTTVIRP